MRLAPLLAALLTASALAACAAGPTGAPGALSERNRALMTAGQARSPYGLFLAGEAALNAGRSDEAAALFARAAAGSPQTGAIQARAFSAALSGGDIRRAARLAAQLPAEDRGSRGLAVVARAVEALGAGRAGEARTLLASADPQPPHGLAAEILKPWAAAAAGDLAGALAPPPVPPPPLTVTPGRDASAPVTVGGSTRQIADTLNQAARLDLLERAGRFDEADALVRAADAASLSPRQTLKIGGYLERRRRSAEAAALYEQALSRRPADRALAAALGRARAGRAAPAMPSLKAGAADSLMIPAVAFAGGRQTEPALAYAHMALYLNPRLDEAWVLVGDLLASAEDLEGARRAYLAPKPDSDLYAPARARLAVLLNENGRKDEALEMARTAAAAAPEDASVLTAKASLLSDAGRKSAAADVFDPALATERGRADWRLWFLRGSMRLDADRWTEAEADLQQALKLAPEEPDVLNSLGYSWIDRGQRLQEALAMVQKAAELRPRSGAIVDSLGWAHYRLGDYAKAVEVLERAAELEPGDPTINDHLGDAYWRVGRRTEAQFQWTRALSLEPEPALRTQVEAKLASPAGPDVKPPTAQATAP